MPQEQRAMTKQVPHLRWSQAPPLPWRRPGSADIGNAINQPAKAAGRSSARQRQSLPLEVTGAINSKTRRSSADSDAPGAEGWEVRLSLRLLGERGHHRMTRMIHEILSFIS